MGSRRNTAAMRALDDYTGAFLLASPDMVDPNFSKTVIFVAEHGKEGAFGLVITREMELTADNIASAMGMSWKGADPAPCIYCGGPVMSETLWLIHDRDEGRLVSKEIVPGIYITSQEEFLRSMIEKPRGLYKFFLGYAGWSEQQLDAEVSTGSWLLPELDPLSNVFSPDPNRIWESALRGMGINPDNYVSGGGGSVN